MKTESDMRISDAITAIPRLSAPNGTKWEHCYEVLESEFGLPRDEVYLTYINKAANTQVRITKQMPSGRRLAIGVCGQQDADSRSFPNQTHLVLAQRPELECVVFLFREDAGEGWVPKLIYGKPSSAIVERVRAVWPTVHVTKVPGSVSRAVEGPASEQAEPDLGDDRSRTVIDLLLRHHNVVLEGVPGTGKTHAVKHVVANWEAMTRRPLAEPTIVVLHPSSAYEDLVEGLRPLPDGAEPSPLQATGDGSASGARFVPTLGRLAEACQRAIADPDQDHLLVLDEFNRANVPRVLGEFLLLLEGSRRAVKGEDGWRPTVDGSARLTYSGRQFFVPSNLYLLATMNTSDASVAPLDAALRRRFVFMRLEPQSSHELLDRLPIAEQGSGQALRRVVDMWDVVNRDLLQALVGPDAMLGHSYFFVLADALRSRTVPPERAIADFLRFALLPQLIDVLSLHGREDLVERDLGPGITSEAVRAVAALRVTLAEFGLSLQVLGSGLGRRIVVADAAQHLDAALEVLASEESASESEFGRQT